MRLWLVVLNRIDEALNNGKAVAQPDRLDAVDGLGHGALKVSGDRLRQHNIESGRILIEEVLFHRCLGSGWGSGRVRVDKDDKPGCRSPQALTVPGNEICTREGIRTLTPEGTRT